MEERALFLLFTFFVLIHVIAVLYHFSFNVVSYNSLAFSYSTSLQDKSDSLLFIILGRSLGIVCFSKNTLKLSGSCMSSMFSVIKQHNFKVLSTTENLDWLCNCWNKENCPLDDKCLQTCIVDVITNKDSHIYYGAIDGEFKSW